MKSHQAAPQPKLPLPLLTTQHFQFLLLLNFLLPALPALKRTRTQYVSFVPSPYLSACVCSRGRREQHCAKYVLILSCPLIPPLLVVASNDDGVVLQRVEKEEQFFY